MWLDLEEGILEEFSERSSEDIYEFIKGDLGSGSMRTFEVSNRSQSDCVICKSKTDRGTTCSKRCAQIRRRQELIASGTCIKCKLNQAKENSQICIHCAPNTESRVGQTIQCESKLCGNSITIARGRASKQKFCNTECRKREATRLRAERMKQARAMYTETT